MVRDELLEGNPALEELFPKEKDLRSLHEMDKTQNLALKKVASSAGSDHKSRDTKKSKGGKTITKTRSTESQNNNNNDGKP